MKENSNNSSYFLYFFIYNLCFLGFQIGLLYLHNASFISEITLPKIVWEQLLITAIIQIGLYLILSLFQTILLLGTIRRSWHFFSADQWQIIIWVLCLCFILSANAYYFPLSAFSKLLTPLISCQWIITILGSTGLILSFLIFNSLFCRHGFYLLSIAIPCMLLFIFHNSGKKLIQPKLSAQPNVIILGIDSLSPKYVNSQNMPFFSKLIKNSSQFTQAISPLARTYPAWASILTGLYSEHHLAAENLVAKDLVKSQNSIAWILKNNGYTTIFSTDDRRFNSMDKEFGFSKIIGPKTGVNDVLLGTFNDFPLGNLLINFRISAWLFPFNYSNRASFFSYYPQTYSEKLEYELSQELHQFPVFLAIHLALPHWPYAWAESLPEQVNNEFSIQNRETLYQRSLNKVDQQFQSLFTYLQKHNYLNHCLLILLSDHGEALYTANSRLTNYSNYQGKLPSLFAQYLKNNTATALNRSAGHGSDILSPMQYHSVLAFRIYKNSQIITQTSQINGRVSLIDLAPTILNFLHLNSIYKMDGLSLMQTILNPSFVVPKRPLFIESGIYPNQLLSKERSMEIGKFLYEVNPKSGELEIKPQQMNAVNQQKLYGIIEGNWILALYPDKKNYIPVIQNLLTGAWTDDLQSNFARSTPASTMYRQMQQFYGSKLFLPLAF
jgi:hypothetical protein